MAYLKYSSYRRVIHRIAEGLCGTCGKNRLTRYKRFCNPCMEKFRAYKRKRNTELYKKGLLKRKPITPSEMLSSDRYDQ